MSIKINQSYETASWERCEIPKDEQIEAAAAAVQKDPEDGDLWMKKGHAYARLSLMREAEECYALAIACNPFNWEYYRHRAHRMLSCWRFQDAAADFTIAARLNPDDWNVFYHLGLSFFLLRDYKRAAKAYRRCYELTDAQPELIAVSDWYYMTLKRLGWDEEAEKVLDRITEHMEPGDNTAYYARLLMYKGIKKPEELLSADPDKVTDLEIVTMGFGIGNYYLMQGEKEKGYEVMEQVIRSGDQSDCYFAFAYLASKVELSAGKQAGV
ncbi:MAG: tetratricopeptide repeat protein [Hungatella sp.]|jgi:tetratricopeptide (TPR) repeat protein|nr:tetratricopeptide repeat protein [Hungatella sp.]